jgi:hypothetical protein
MSFSSVGARHAVPEHASITVAPYSETKERILSFPRFANAKPQSTCGTGRNACATKIQKMHVRPYTSADLDALRRIHARQGFDYAFPDLADPIFISKLVDLLSRGFDDAHAWLPPPIARRFGRRLEALGWIRDDAWTPYCRRLKK